MHTYCIRILFIFLFVCLRTTLLAYNFSVDGIYYNIVSSASKYVSVTFANNQYASYSGDVIIPSKVIYNGVTYTVTSVDSRAFCYSEALTSVQLPSTITSIGYEAFYFCKSLKSVNFPSALRKIDEGAFYYCISLETANMVGNLLSIGDAAFRYCKSIKSINIPRSVEEIGECAFSDCSGVTSFVVEDGNHVFDSRDNCNALIDSRTNTIIMGTSGTKSIPSTVVAIGNSAFSNMSNLTSIDIPTSVIAIGSLAFESCTRLENVQIPNSVTSLGRGAFSGCSRLKNMTLPNSITELPDEIFWNCSSLSSIEIPNSVVKIGQSAFYNCKAVSSLIIPESVSNIMPYAFCNCTSLSKVTVYTKGKPLNIDWSVFSGAKLYSASLQIRRRHAAEYVNDAIWSGFGTISPFEPILGDADSSEIVDMDDLKLLSSYLIGEELDYIDLEALDLDESGSVTIADLTLLVKMLREKTLP